jgi:alpha-ribazole phosphatase
MNLYLLRHTQTAVPAGICYGQSDVSLADSFLTERDEIRKNLEEVRFDRIFSSPLHRCRALAEHVAGDNPIEYDARLMELNFGFWEMKDWNEISRTCHAQQWFDNYLEMACPGGESYAQLLARVTSFVDDLREKKYTHVLIVTHGGVIRSVNCILNDIQPHKAFELEVAYGSILKLEINTLLHKNE